MRARALLSAALALVASSAQFSYAGDPKTTNEFITLCDGVTPSTACLVQYMLVLESYEWGPSEGHGAAVVCAPDSLPDAELRREVRIVVSWLKNRPDLARAKVNDGVGAALKANFPCR